MRRECEVQGDDWETYVNQNPDDFVFELQTLLCLTLVWEVLWLVGVS